MQEPWWVKLVFLLLGAIVSLIGAFVLWHSQLRHQNKTLATGLLTEVSSMEPTLQLYADAFEKPGPGSGKVTIEQPIYSPGLYERAGRDVFALDHDTAHLLFEFHTALSTAERNRTVVPADRFFAQANEEMKRCIMKANGITPELKTALKREAGQ